MSNLNVFHYILVTVYDTQIVTRIYNNPKNNLLIYWVKEIGII